MTTTYYKVLDQNGRSVHGGDMQWPLPHGGKPGAWTPKITDPIPCERGYHILTLDQAPQWLKTVGLWEVEPRGRLIPHNNDKWVCQSARLTRRVNQWNPRTIRLLAALWVEYLLSQGRYDWETQEDRDELTHLVDVTRRYADGGSSSEELREARSWSSSLSWSLSSLSSSWSSSPSLERQWLRDRWIELLTAPGDWSHVSWEEW